MANKTLVTGEVSFPSGTTSFSDGTLIIKLEDVSMMGGPSSEIAKTVVTNVKYDGKAIPFKLTGSIPGDNDERSRYNVRVQVSFHGDDDDIQKGDYITTQSYPVLTHGNPDRVNVTVKKV